MGADQAGRETWRGAGLSQRAHDQRESEERNADDHDSPPMVDCWLDRIKTLL